MIRQPRFFRLNKLFIRKDVILAWKKYSNFVVNCSIGILTKHRKLGDRGEGGGMAPFLTHTRHITFEQVTRLQQLGLGFHILKSELIFRLMKNINKLGLKTQICLRLQHTNAVL